MLLDLLYIYRQLISYIAQLGLYVTPLVLSIILTSRHITSLGIDGTVCVSHWTIVPAPRALCPATVHHRELGT
jgi:hypothetical protein